MTESEVVREVTAIANAAEQAEQIRTAAEALILKLKDFEYEEWAGNPDISFADFVEAELTSLKGALSRGWLSRGKADRPMDKIQPECIDRYDLEIVDYYFANCAECRKGTNPGSEWLIVAADAMDAGWRKMETEVYCKDCLPLITQRIEEQQEEDESGWRNRNL